MKNVVLQKMNETEFAAFAQKSIADYAKDLILSEGLPAEEASEKAREEFFAMLPQGADTPDQFPMTVLVRESAAAAGFLWYLREETDGKKQVFLCDLQISEEYRRKGYAQGALHEMEAAAKKDGCAESVLYVRRDNLPAFALYRKCGYRPFREGKNGTYFKKAL